jgi:hypothetical protein
LAAGDWRSKLKGGGDYGSDSDDSDDEDEDEDEDRDEYLAAAAGQVSIWSWLAFRVAPAADIVSATIYSRLVPTSL